MGRGPKTGEVLGGVKYHRPYRETFPTEYSFFHRLVTQKHFIVCPMQCITLDVCLSVCLSEIPIVYDSVRSL